MIDLSLLSFARSVIFSFFCAFVVCEPLEELVNINAAQEGSISLYSNNFLNEGTKWILRGPPGQSIAIDFLANQNNRHSQTAQTIWNFLNPNNYQHQSQYQSSNTPGYFRLFNGDSFAEDFIEITDQSTLSNDPKISASNSLIVRTKAGSNWNLEAYSTELLGNLTYRLVEVNGSF
jgi:hypothetical protein